MTALDEHTETEERKPAPVKLMFPNHMAFFSWFARTFRRDLQDDGRYAWCSEWWRHPEAVQIMKALHESFEVHCGKPLTLPRSDLRAEWLTYFAYPLINKLLDPHGTFSGCSYEAGGHVTDRTSVLPMTVDPTGRYPVD
jgi:uncharacterized protein DUF4913